jgi:spore maturation protein CgeB
MGLPATVGHDSDRTDGALRSRDRAVEWENMLSASFSTSPSGEVSPAVRAMPLARQHVLAVSPVGAYDGFNTSVHRVRALESLGADVDVVDTALIGISTLADLRFRVQHRLFARGLGVNLSDPTHTCERVVLAARRRHFDIIWLEKALTIGPEIVRRLRGVCPKAKIIGFSPDDMCQRHNQSRQFVEALRYYDYFITTKSHNLQQLRELGCKEVVVVGNGFDPDAFRPVSLTSGDVERFGGDVGFIGSFEPERAELLFGLARAGISVRVWGQGWSAQRARHPKLRLENRGLFHDDYAKACGAFKINLGFLRKLNHDQQTTRSVEIPACAGFMLAERTAEHLALFEEGAEAEFFASAEELLGKCRHYLEDEAARVAIARRGYERCVASGYSNAARLREAFRAILA